MKNLVCEVFGHCGEELEEEGPVCERCGDIYMGPGGPGETWNDRVWHWAIVEHPKFEMAYYFVFTGAWKCLFQDHDIETDDYGTPESGGMGWHCKRCGVGSWTQMY